MPFGLSTLAKAFNLDMDKSFFPLLMYNSMDFVGSLPPQEMFAPESMSLKRYEEFQIWYKNRLEADEPFCYREELVRCPIGS